MCEVRGQFSEVCSFLPRKNNALNTHLTCSGLTQIRSLSSLHPAYSLWLAVSWKHLPHQHSLQTSWRDFNSQLRGIISNMWVQRNQHWVMSWNLPAHCIELHNTDLTLPPQVFPSYFWNLPLGEFQLWDLDSCLLVPQDIHYCLYLWALWSQFTEPNCSTAYL